MQQPTQLLITFCSNLKDSTILSEIRRGFKIIVRACCTHQLQTLPVSLLLTRCTFRSSERQGENHQAVKQSPAPMAEKDCIPTQRTKAAISRDLHSTILSCVLSIIYKEEAEEISFLIIALCWINMASFNRLLSINSQ